MLYVYYSSNSAINKEQADRYIEHNKGKVVEDSEIIPSIILNPLSQLALIIDKKDDIVINLIIELKLKRSIKVITRSVEVANTLKDKVVSVYIIDDITENMPDFWDNDILHFKNLQLLWTANKRPINYEFSIKSESVMYTAHITSIDVDGVTAKYVSFVNLSQPESMNEFKKEYDETKKQFKQIMEDRKKEDNKTFTELKHGTPQPVYVYKNISDYILRNRYASKEQLEDARQYMLNYSHKDLSIEKALSMQGVFSKEDLVVILRGYLNTQVIGKQELDSMTICYSTVTDKLKALGVTEAYQNEDTEHRNAILIIPYNKKETLIDVINKTISYSSILLTLPEYLEDINREYAN